MGAIPELPDRQRHQELSDDCRQREQCNGRQPRSPVDSVSEFSPHADSIRKQTPSQQMHGSHDPQQNSKNLLCAAFFEERECIVSNAGIEVYDRFAAAMKFTHSRSFRDIS